MNGDQLASEILDLGKAIGLFDDGGNLQTSWFDNPLGHVGAVLTTDSQRAAFLRLLDALLPPIQSATVPANETWHPLLGDQTRGNAYLTVNTANAVTFGFAGDFHSTDGPPPLAELEAHLPLVSFAGGNLVAVAGTANGPLDVSLTIHLGLAFGADPIGLDSVVVTASLAPLGGSAAATLTVTLEGLQLDSTGPQNIQLDPSNLGAEAIHLIIGLIREQLSRLAGPTGEAAAVANHLLQLLGFGSDGIPQFPFTQLSEPGALNGWFASLLQGGATAPIVAWLDHLIGLLGSGSVTVTGTGTESDPWVAPIIEFGSAAGSGLAITLATQTLASTTSLLAGLEVRVIPSGAPPPVRIEGSAVLASIPIVGAGSAVVLPQASVVAHAPGALSAGALVSTASFTVQSISAGFTWTGSTLQPQLELDAVDLTIAAITTHYDKVDLTNADSVASDVSHLIGSTIAGYLGTSSPGRNLAALAGIIPPENDPASPHSPDLTQLVSNPARAIAAVHRAVLLDPAHGWSHMLEEIGGLIGITSAVTGTGTGADPWVLSLAPPSGFHIEIAAWNDQTSGVASDVQKLRVGLRASFSEAPVELYWLAELLAFDLPQSGAGSVSLMAGQHAHFAVQPIPGISPVAGLALSIGDLGADMTWQPGSPLVWSAGLHNLTVTYAGSVISIPAIGFPLGAPFDVSNPAAIAADFGLTVPNLELLLRVMLARALFSWGGTPAYTLAGLLGVHGGLAGLPADWPALADPGAAGSLLSDPFTALRNWVGAIATGASADGSGFLPQILPWLRGLFSAALPSVAGGPLPAFSLPIGGSGTYEDPWTLPLTTTAASSLDALLWLEPAGPPPGWATPLIGAATGATDFFTLFEMAQSLAGFLPDLSSGMAQSDAGVLSTALGSLSSFFASGDGVVALASQVPSSPNWTPGTTLSSAHSAQPSDPAAIAQILAQIDNLAGGAAGARTVLLLGPAFSDHNIWTALLSDPGLHGTTAAGTNFNLRVPGLDASAVDLTGVVAQAAYYSADLSDDGSGNLASLSAQIGRVIARIQQLNGSGAITLVAHSTAGLAALAYTAANPTLVQGLITLGTPHLGADLPFLSNSGIADALRIVQILRPQLAAGPIRDALDFLLQVLDGYLPPATAGALPVAWPFPAGSFPAPTTATASIDSGGRPVFAIGSQLGGTLLSTLTAGLAGLATSAANPATKPAAPTHLAFGARAHINSATTAGSVFVDTTLRGDLFQLALKSGAAAPPHPAHALHVRATLTNSSGWLVGQSSAVTATGLPPEDVRVRWAELGADVYATSGGVEVDPVVNLHQVSWHGPVTPAAVFSDANCQALLGALFESISSPAPLPTSPTGVLLATLEVLKVAVADSHGGMGISADAWNAITADAGGYLGTQLTAALSAGTSLAGFSATTAVVAGRGTTAIPEWTLALSSLPIEVYLAPGPPWTLGLRTVSTGGAAGWSIANQTSVQFDSSVQVPGFAATLDAGLTLGAFTLAWASGSSQLTVSAAPWLQPLTLIPAPSAATLASALNGALPRLLFSAAASAVLEALAGPGLTIGPVDTFFTSMSSVLTRATALGNSAGTGLDSAKLTALLQFIGTAAGLPAGPGLSLPGDLSLTATGAGTDADPVKLELVTTSPIGGVATVSGGVAFDKLMHPSPTGAVAFTIPLPTATWTGITVAFGIGVSGVTLSVAPVSTPATAPIQILPTFSGLGALAGAAEALLPQALDAAVTAIGPSTVATLTLDVASALGIYDSVGGFKAHADALKSMLSGSWLSGFTGAQRGSIATAIAGLFSGGSPLAGTLPGTVTAGSGSSAGVVTWAFPLSGGDTGTVSVGLGWDATGPTATVGIASLKLADGALAITASAGFAAGTVAVAADLGLHLENAIGIDLVPTLSLTESGGSFALEFYPLVSGTGNGPITIDLIPPAIHMAAGGSVQLIEQWLLPLVGDTLLASVADKFSTALWTGGPLLRDVLTGAEIAVASGPGLILNPALPDVTGLVTGLLSTLANNVGLAITSTLNLVLANDGGRLGVRIQGSQDFPVGDYVLSMLFGAPTEWGSNFDAGVTVYLFEVSGSTFTFNPGILAVGLGLGLTGQDDGPLVNTGGFRMGGVRLYSFFRGEFASGFNLDWPGAGVEIDQLGLPLSQATGPNVGGNNPVASGLLGGGGDGGNGGGDTQPLNPALDVAAWYWTQPTDGSHPTPSGDSTFHILFAGNDQPIWIGVHAQLGPIYLDQIGIILNGNTSASLVLDATVKVGPLTGQVDELGVTIPFASVLDPGKWTLDLKGLALSFETPGVSIAGALLKNDSGPAIEYDGMLLIEITEFGLIAVGAYSKPKDASGDYTSVFVFAGLYIIIGIPPIIEIEAIGLGVGYNRELIVPDDINQIPGFILVAALDDGGALANDPMGELMQIRDSIPAKRGSLWLAVGLHGTTFVIVHVTAIVYVALDRGVEIGILGVARMAIPSDDTALVSVELALKARYSSAESVLSIQAQLTSNSYIFDPDCQLTGGFAYFMWFAEGQFVLTLGGYNPHFQPPTQFPVVPRLGFNWGLPIGATIKGENYFALTNTCIMAGGRLELTYGISCAYIWFTAFADFLISWDPFYYEIDLGISVGATFSIQACFWGVCIGVSVTVSLGATLTIAGPPLHGTATVDLAICSVTVAFGSTPNPKPSYISDFNVFATKYLYGNDPNGNAFRVNVLSGLVPPAPSGAAPAPGTSDKPWKMVSEFSFQCDTKMPATITTDFVFGDQDQAGKVHSIDLAPMFKETVGSQMVVTLWGKNGSGWTEITVGDPDQSDYQIDTVHWRMTPIIGKVSEATWHWNDPTNMPAAANTIPAVVGLKIEGFCYLEGQSALIPIAKLHDKGSSRPLPFATGFTLVFPVYQGYGASAVLLSEITAGASSQNTLQIASAILSGGGFFADQRVASGLASAGNPPVANRALLYSRSSPPMIVPLTTGLTMAPPALPAPPVIVPVPPAPPVTLAQPRLRAVLRGLPQVVSDTPPALRTTVTGVAAAAGVQRMAAPLADALGSRLVRVAAPTAPAATKIAKAASTLRSTDLGWTSGTAQQTEMANALSGLTTNGLSIPAGCTHIWDVPAGVQSELVVTGDSAFRITFLTRGGAVILDSEYPSASQTSAALPGNCAMVSVECLGKLPAGSPAITAGFAAVAFTAAPAGKQTVAGWQAGNLLPQVGPTTILGRGACLLLPQTYIPLRSRQAISQTMVRASDAVAEQIGTETWLPISIGVVMILLDLEDATASADGDLSLSADGATLSSSPIRILGGRRRALLYDVSNPDPKAGHITIGVASLTGWRISGVVGMAGNAQEWATSLQGKVPEHIVADGPLTPDGSISIRMVPLPATPAAKPNALTGALK